LLRPRNKSNPAVRKRKSRRPKLPIRVGKAHQVLSGAIICGDHELASWLDLALKTDRVVGTTEGLKELRQRMDAVMDPLPETPPPLTA
jgi:hypothetical protein